MEISVGYAGPVVCFSAMSSMSIISFPLVFRCLDNGILNKCVSTPMQR